MVLYLGQFTISFLQSDGQDKHLIEHFLHTKPSSPDPYPCIKIFQCLSLIRVLVTLSLFAVTEGQYCTNVVINW